MDIQISIPILWQWRWKGCIRKKSKDLYEMLLEEQNKSQDLSSQLDILKAENEYLKSWNLSLSNYIENVLMIQNFCNSGKQIDDLQQRQKLRKLKTLESYAEKALSFAETFGLKLNNLEYKTESGKNVTLKLGENKDEIDTSNYSNLDSDDKDLIKQLISLLDKFCISDSAYHELSMIVGDLPRKYVLIQHREDINKMYHIERLPGNKPIAMLNLNTEVEKLLKFEISQSSTELSKFKIKFSGDGAKVSRISNFVIFFP